MRAFPIACACVLALGCATQRPASPQPPTTREPADAEAEAGLALANSRYNLGLGHRDRYRETHDLEAFRASEQQFQAMLMENARELRAHAGLAGLYYERAVAGEEHYALLAADVVGRARALQDEDRAARASLLNVEGLLALRDGRPDEALRAFEAAAAANPSSAAPRLNAAHILLRARAFEDASRHLRIATRVARGRARVDAALALGQACSGLGDIEGARAAYEQAVELDANDPRADYNLGMLFKQAALPNTEDGPVLLMETAQRRFERFIRRAGEDPRYAEAIASAELHVGEIERWLRPGPPHRRLDPEAQRLEELQRQQERADRWRVLELERRAKEALEEHQRGEE
jgi:tetratricopeptide (TPR) repeat protein